MADVPTKNTVPVISNWHEAIPGLTGQILKTYFENPKSFPPAKGSWKTNKMGVPIDIPSWDAAYEFVHTYQSWSVGLGVFHVYMDARTAAANQNPQTGLHRHVLLKYFMPVWFFQELKKWCVKVYARSTVILFTYLQLSASFLSILGPPAGGFDDYGTINSRRFRGAIVFAMITAEPHKGKTAPSAEERDDRAAIVQALCYVLAIPGSYEQELKTYNCTVEPVEQLEHWPRSQMTFEHLTTEKVVRRLANMGLSIMTAHDMFPFVQDYLTEGFDLELLKGIHNAMQDGLLRIGEPEGLINEPYGEFLAHPPGLHWPDTALNATLVRGIRLPHLPTAQSACGSKKPRHDNLRAALQAGYVASSWWWAWEREWGSAGFCSVERTWRRIQVSRIFSFVPTGAVVRLSPPAAHIRSSSRAVSSHRDAISPTSASSTPSAIADTMGRQFPPFTREFWLIDECIRQFGSPYSSI
ncbi:hypothetical protein R3P38DRAFT_3215761 [Favolaschia claudopus]|uniref:Uncharacterized protein n=1 Tax=Favolaschia claudopus TaxID=2862362 RepID=A0AAW0A721_9AGAR